MTVTSKCDNGRITLIVEGRVDSTTAPIFEENAEKILAENAHTEVYIDADGLEYISSAGLRVMLKLLKQEKNLTVINASSEVYDIFEMTGFSEMIDVQKAYRRVSVEGCEVIGKGANGEVYRLDPETIVKVYLNPDSLDDIKRERELARRAFVLGVPTAISYDVVRIGDSYGSMFELLNAKSLAKLIAEEPENLDKFVGDFVGLLKTIHSTELKPGEIPDIKDTVYGWLSRVEGHIDGARFEKLKKLVDATPDTCTMIHGDYHPKNVMMQNGEALLIDMDTLTEGHPVFEFGSIFNAFMGFSTVDHTTVEHFLGIKYDISVQFWKKTLRLYFGTGDEAKLEEYENKARLVGYLRLLQRNIRKDLYKTEDGKVDYDAFKENLEKYIDKVDSLDF